MNTERRSPNERKGRAEELAPVIQHNIESLNRAKAEHEQRKGLEERFADLLTRFTGSMVFVYLHAAWFVGWIGWNLGLLGGRPFDPPPFGVLTLIVSLEAIFLSTFVL